MKNQTIKSKDSKVLIDSKTAIDKIEPFIALGTRGVNFVIREKNLEKHVINAVRGLSSKYRMQVVVKDKTVIDMLGDIATNAVVGANIGLAVWLLLPITPGLINCVVGGAAIGALTASLKIIITRSDDGDLVLAT